MLNMETLFHSYNSQFEAKLVGALAKFMADEHQAFLAWYVLTYLFWHWFVPLEIIDKVNEMAVIRQLKKGFLCKPKTQDLIINSAFGSTREPPPTISSNLQSPDVSNFNVSTPLSSVYT